jgi:hypothetical protein
MTSPIGDTGCRRSKMSEISMPRPYRVIPAVPIAGYRNWTSGCDGECTCATGSSGNGRAHGGGISSGSFQCSFRISLGTLRHAHEQGYRTSVSMESMIEPHRRPGFGS